MPGVPTGPERSGRKNSLSHRGSREVIIRQVPGHVGIPGNEAADHEASKAAKAATLAYPKGQRASQGRFMYWTSIMPERYSVQGARNALEKSPNIVETTTLHARQVIACRSDHGGFDEYHVRFGHKDADWHCKCGRAKTPTHFYFCQLARKDPNGQANVQPEGHPRRRAAPGKSTGELQLRASPKSGHETYQCFIKM